MSRTIITVTRHKTLVNVFQVSAAGGGARPGRQDVRDSGAAAAFAMQLAIRHGAAGYHVFGPSEVMAHIPEDMRGKA